MVVGLQVLYYKELHGVYVLHITFGLPLAVLRVCDPPLLQLCVLVEIWQRGSQVYQDTHCMHLVFAGCNDVRGDAPWIVPTHCLRVAGRMPEFGRFARHYLRHRHPCASQYG